MRLLARLHECSALAVISIGLLVPAVQAIGADAFLRNQRLPALQSLAAPSAVLAAEPICDIFANGYDATGAGPCASCFDATTNFGETDVDCGGPYCKACATGLKCSADADCQSGKCSSNVCTDALLISQVQSRGDGGANDEFIELYNPTGVAVIFDDTWSVRARSAVSTCTSDLLLSRFIGAGQVIPAHGHLLYVSSAYNGSTSGDGTYAIGLADAASVVLEHNSAVVDALCFYYDAATQNALTGCSAAYICEGTPIMGTHDSTNSTNVDASFERKPGGTGGNMTDTGNNANDFLINSTPDPHNLASSPTP